MSFENFLLLLSGVPATLAVTFGGLAIGAVLAFPLLALRNAPFWPVRVAVILLIAVVRSVPPIVWLFLIFFSIGSGIFPISPMQAALVGFGIIATVNIAEIYRAGLNAVHGGQHEAAQALNMNRMHGFVDIIAPQMFRVCTPMLATYAIGLLKDAAVASTIGVQDLTYQGNYITQQTYDGLSVMGFVGLLYIAISLPVAWLSRMADARVKRMVAL